MSRVIGFRRIRRLVNSTSWANLTMAMFCLAVSLPLLSHAHGDEDADSSVDREKVKAERAARVEAMHRRAASLTAKVKNNDGEFIDAKLVEPPLLAYNNVTNLEIDATLWAWGKRGRPVAIAALHEDRGDRKLWSCEMVSLADQAVSIAAKPGWRWAPAQSDIEWKPVPGAPAPGKTAVARSAQIKDIAGRFASTGHYRNGNVVELRLMGRPLHRYADPEAGLIDGALSAFAEGTNPETMLLIECRSDKDQQQTWFYGFTRMSGGRLVARLDDTVVWECQDTRGFDPEGAYSSYYGLENSVFGSIEASP